MKIEILGTGCAKCNALAGSVRKSVEELGIEAEIEKVTDLREIMKYNVLMTPALVVEGVVKAAGRVPSPEELRKILAAGGGQ